MATIGTRIFTALRGRLVGRDALGNLYYEDRRLRRGNARQRRWVIYNGVDEASSVPAEWFGWLHHTSDAALPETVRKSWQTPFVPNLTGTPASYRPVGHDYSGGKRVRTPGDYEAWSPEE
jgi:NADH:ubiquinone oxidoreductase subunit